MITQLTLLKYDTDRLSKTYSEEKLSNIEYLFWKNYQKKKTIRYKFD